MPNSTLFDRFPMLRVGRDGAILCLILCSLALGAPRHTDADTITAFDVPDAGIGLLQGTHGVSINTAGAIAGYYYDAAAIGHGFLRLPHGAIITFDAPGGGTGA